MSGFCRRHLRRHACIAPHPFSPSPLRVSSSVAASLASLCATMILTVSPDTIILSGGVMQNAALFPKIHEKVCGEGVAPLSHASGSQRAHPLFRPTVSRAAEWLCPAGPPAENARDRD